MGAKRTPLPRRAMQRDRRKKKKKKKKNRKKSEWIGASGSSWISGSVDRKSVDLGSWQKQRRSPNRLLVTMTLLVLWP